MEDPKSYFQGNVLYPEQAVEVEVMDGILDYLYHCCGPLEQHSHLARSFIDQVLGTSQGKHFGSGLCGKKTMGMDRLNIHFSLALLCSKLSSSKEALKYSSR